MGNKLIEFSKGKYREGRRIVAPLVGFPGVNLIGSNIKIAQQNYGGHYKVLKKVVDEFLPDLIFPLMDLSVEANALGMYTLFPREDSATVHKEKFSIEELNSFREINISFDSRVNRYVDTVKLMKIGLPAKILKGAYVTGPYSLAGLLMGADEAATILHGTPEQVKEEVNELLDEMEPFPNFILSTGCDLPQETPYENIKAFMDAGRSYKIAWK